MQGPRVVVTGLGMVSPLGNGAGYNWEAILRGKSGIRKLNAKEVPEFLPCRIGGTIPTINKDSHDESTILSPDPHRMFGKFVDWNRFRGSELRQMSRASAIALIAAAEALDDAGLITNYLHKTRNSGRNSDSNSWRDEEISTATNSQQPKPQGFNHNLLNSELAERTGVAIGMGISDLEDIHKTGELLRAGRASKVSPYFVPKILTNMGAGQIGIKYGLAGPNHSVSTACSTGAHSIGDAFHLIKLGHADVMICGSAEACVNPISLAGFSRCRALATSFNSCPTEASRPFDSRREGFVMGEGSGVIILESLEHVQSRIANFESCPDPKENHPRPPKIYAEVIGYGMSSDGYHLTSPDPSGKGAYLAMKRALGNGKVSIRDIGYINAHATSTPLGDLVESRAISQLLEEEPQSNGIGTGCEPAISSNKGAIGHLLGAAGSVEAAFTVLSIFKKTIPPTLNLSESDIPFRLNFVRENPQDWTHTNSKRVALSNSFGFGGTNATLCFSQFSK